MYPFISTFFLPFPFFPLFALHNKVKYNRVIYLLRISGYFLIHNPPFYIVPPLQDRSAMRPIHDVSGFSCNHVTFSIFLCSHASPCSSKQHELQTWLPLSALFWNRDMLIYSGRSWIESTYCSLYLQRSSTANTAFRFHIENTVVSSKYYSLRLFSLEMTKVTVTWQYLCSILFDGF